MKTFTIENNHYSLTPGYYLHSFIAVKGANHNGVQGLFEKVVYINRYRRKGKKPYLDGVIIKNFIGQESEVDHQFRMSFDNVQDDMAIVNQLIDEGFQVNLFQTASIE